MDAFRVVVALALLAMVPGCSEPAVPPAPSVHETPCADLPPTQHTFYFGPGLTLNATLGPSGKVPGNGYDEAFLTNDLATWMSAPVPEGLLIQGNVTLEAWVDVRGPVAQPDRAKPGQDFVFFNQFGSDRGFQSGTAREYLPAMQLQGIVHLNETLTMPPGGFVVERGDRLRVLITSLVASDGGDPGTYVLFGNGTPSQVRFQARCSPVVEWQIQRYLRQPVVVVANQGGPTGLPGLGCTTIGPQDLCLNRQDIPFTLENGTERLRVFLRTQDADRRPKSDMDLRLLDDAGHVVYDASTPFVNETFVLWKANLDAFVPPGQYILRADLYGGGNYSGLLEIALEHDAHEDDGA